MCREITAGLPQTQRASGVCTQASRALEVHFCLIGTLFFPGNSGPSARCVVTPTSQMGNLELRWVTPVTVSSSEMSPAPAAVPGADSHICHQPHADASRVHLWTLFSAWAAPPHLSITQMTLPSLAAYSGLNALPHESQHLKSDCPFWQGHTSSRLPFSQLSFKWPGK